MKVLAICAHPDDEMGCSGSLKRYVNEGHEVFIYWLGGGRPAKTFGEQTKQEKVKHKVLDILGVKEVSSTSSRILGELKDNQFDDVPLLCIIEEIENVIDTVKPQIIFSHTESCLNSDHVITAKAVKTAIARRDIKEVYAFEVLSSTEWNYTDSFKPNYFVDITSTINHKIQALECYQSELRDWPHPRNHKGILALAQYRGMQSGLAAAEGFEVIRILLHNISNY